MELLGDERKRRRLAVDHDRHQLVGRAGEPVAVEAKHLRRFLHRPRDRPGDDRRAELVELELELGDDAEVRAGATDTPEEIRVLVLARGDELAVGGDDVDGEQLVDGQPEFPHQPADPTAERESGEAGMRNDSGRHREPELLRLAVELAQKDSRLCARGPLLWIDADSLHRAEVDQQCVVGHGEAWEAVAAASDGDVDAGSAREPNCRHDVGNPGAARDQRRAAVDRAVPDASLGVVGRILAADELASQRRLELRDGGLLEPGVGCNRHPMSLAREGTTPQSRLEVDER